MKKETKNPELPLVEICEYWIQEAGSNVIVIFFFHEAQIFVADPQVVKAIVMDIKNDKPKSFNRAFSHTFGERFLGNGLVTVVDYETWKPKRKLYDSSFNKSYLKTLVEPLNSLVDHFLEELKPLADGKTEVLMSDHVRDFTLGVVSKVVFGTDFNKIWDSQSLNITLPAEFKNPLTYVISKVLDGCQKGFFSIHPGMLQYLHPFEAKGYQEAARAMRMIGRDCIQRGIKAVESGQKVPHGVLSQILQSASLKETHSLEDLVDDFCSFYTAGHDTTANLLLFAIIRVHQHPNILSRLKEEVKEVLGDKKVVTAEDLDKLTYTEQILTETLRVHQTVPCIMKVLHSEQTICGKCYPSNTEFVMLSPLMSRMPEYFDEPDIFNPDRFNAENERPDSFVFFPFGSGHRVCIAKYLAMMEAKMLLSRLIQTYSLNLPEDYELTQIESSTLQPKGKVPCVLKSII